MRGSFARIGLVAVLALGLVALTPPGEAEARRGRPGWARGHGGHRHAMAAHYRGPRRGPAVYHRGAVRRGPVVYHRGGPRWRVYAPPPPVYYPGPRVRVVVPGPPVVVVPAPRVVIEPAPRVVRPAPRVYVPAEPAPEEHFHEHYYYDQEPQAPETGHGDDRGYEDDTHEHEGDAYEGAPYEGEYEGDSYDPPGGTAGPGWRPGAPEPHYGPAPEAAPPAERAPAEPAGEVLTTAELQRIEGEILNLVNAERNRRGLEPLSPEPRMARAAAQHSGEMYSLDYFAHESPVEGNESFTDRLGNAGLKDFGSAAENIVMSGHGPDVARRLVDLWLGSPAHLENILRPEFRWTGVGVFGDRERVYATQLFASEVR